MLRLRHLLGLLGDLGAFSVATRTIWMVPFALVLVAVAVAAATTVTVVPYTVYTLF